MASSGPNAELAARRQLAERLRALRVGAGLSTTQLAHRLGWSQAKVSRIETATHGVAPGDVRSWAEALDVPAEQVEQLVEQAWTASIEVRSFRHELAAGYASGQAAAGQREEQAMLLRSLQHLVVPALLQIRPYAVALFQRACPIAQDAEQAADARLARQRVLDDPERRFEWVVTEAALWWRPAEWAVQAEQIRAVAAATARPTRSPTPSACRQAMATGSNSATSVPAAHAVSDTVRTVSTSPVSGSAQCRQPSSP